MPWILFTRRWVPFTLLALLATVLCGRLGVWQLDRLAQRRAANARIAYAISLPAVELPAAENLADQEYRAVRAQGTYDFGSQVALRNQASGGEYGYHLLTPLLLQGGHPAGARIAVLVDRGWIPADGNQNPDDWRKYDLPGTVEVVGVVRRVDPVVGSRLMSGASAAADKPAGKFVLVVDPGQISSQIGYQLASFYVQATGAEHPTLPMADAPNLDLSNGPHLGYAIQWFSFALIIPAGFAYYVRRQEASGP
jgi:surfeit locus 1 family protein